MSGAYSPHGEMRYEYNFLLLKILKGRDHMENLSIGEMLI
jgi:hypothetical protein